MKHSNIYTDGTYLSRNPTYHEEDAPWKVKHIKEIIKRNNINSKTICEVGCGSGEVLSLLKKTIDNDAFYVGYDISFQAIELCKKKESANIIYRCGNLLNDNEKYDLLLFIDVIEHIEDYIGFLRAVKSRSKYKIMFIPLGLSCYSLLRINSLMNTRYTVGHIHYFTKEIVFHVLNDLNYNIIDYYITGMFFETASTSAKAWLLNLFRSLFYSINQDLTARILGGFNIILIAT